MPKDMYKKRKRLDLKKVEGNGRVRGEVRLMKGTQVRRVRRLIGEVELGPTTVKSLPPEKKMRRKKTRKKK